MYTNCAPNVGCRVPPRATQRGLRPSTLAGIIGLLLMASAACAADTPASYPYKEKFQSQCVMTWPRDRSDRGVTDVEDWSVTRDGRVYVATQGRVKEFGPTGRLRRATEPALWGGIEWFAVDSKGCIYAIHGGTADVLSKFDSQGKLVSADPTQTDDFGPPESQRLRFEYQDHKPVRLISGEIESFADRVRVECAEHNIHTEFLFIQIDDQNRICLMMLPFYDQTGYPCVAFNTDGYFLSTLPAMPPKNVDAAGRKYLIDDQVRALTMYSPTDEVLRVYPEHLPVDGPTFLTAWDQGTPEGHKAFEEGQEMACGPTVDDAGNLYLFTVQTPNPEAGITGELHAYKMDNAGHVLGRSTGIPPVPDASDHYVPLIDPRGQVWWLNFLPDRTEVMRGTFAP